MLGTLGLGAPTWRCQHCMACVFTRFLRRAQVIFLPGSPRVPGRWFHTWPWNSKANIQSDLISLLIFPAVFQLLSSSSSLSSISHLNNWRYHPSATRKKNPSWNRQTAMEDPCLGPVESADNKGRSRIYPRGTRSLRGKIQLLFMLPPKYVS